MCLYVFSREKGAFSLLTDPRINPLSNGGLEIFNVTNDDQGTYICSVFNSNLSISANLDVFSECDTLTQKQLM